MKKGKLLPFYLLLSIKSVLKRKVLLQAKQAAKAFTDQVPLQVCFEM